MSRGRASAIGGRVAVCRDGDGTDDFGPWRWSYPTMDAPSEPRPELVDLPSVPTAVVAAVIAPDELVAFFDRSYGQIATVAAEQGIELGGAAFARYNGPPGERIDLEVGFPVERPVEGSGEVRAGTLPAGRVARVVHRGGFDGLGAAWAGLETWMGEQGLVPGPVLWEVYLTEPSPDMDPADLRTELNRTVG